MSDRGYIPRRPSGDDAEALFHQAVWDYIWGGKGRLIDVPGKITFDHTTKGIVPNVKFPLSSTSGLRTPFRIYQSDTWLDFKVTTGWVITTGTPIEPTGVETEITITSGVARYWFYVDFIDPETPTITTSATTQEWSTTKIPLGWVDTDTYSADERSVIHQFYPLHLFNPCVEAV